MFVVFFADLYAAQRVDVRKPFQTVHFACQAHGHRSRAERERERAHEVSSPRRAAGAQRARMPVSSAIFRHQRHETPLQMQTDPGKPLLSRLWKARTRAPAPNLEKYPTTLNIHGNPGLHKGPENPTFPSNGKVLGDARSTPQKHSVWRLGRPSKHRQITMQNCWNFLGAATTDIPRRPWRSRSKGASACFFTACMWAQDVCGEDTREQVCLLVCGARTRRSPHRAGDHTPRAEERTGCHRRAAAHLRLLWRCNRQCSLCARAFVRTPLMRPAVRQSEHEHAFEPTATLAPCPRAERARAS